MTTRQIDRLARMAYEMNEPDHAAYVTWNWRYLNPRVRARWRAIVRAILEACDE